MEVPQKLKDAVVCAIMGELANRSISFLISQWRNRMSATDQEERLEESLQRLLLRIRAVVEEAEGRHITGHAMLQQLSILREEMYVGYYTLDHTLRRRATSPAADGGDQVSSSHSFALSEFSPAKRLRVVRSEMVSAREELRRVVGSLEAVVGTSLAEFIALSGRYPPRLLRQPYSAHLLMDRFMFGRQMEMEHVVSFLLRAEPESAPPGSSKHLGVLPIVGPGKVGKSTLVQHACIDDRVRGRFSRTMLLSGGAADDLIKIEGTNGSPAERVLIILELDGNIDEGSWRRLSTAVRSSRVVARGSKMIVTSRSDSIARLGTSLPLRLRFLAPQAYWYFFKVRTFGSTDVSEHPELASIAMDIARELNGCFVAANIFRGALKSNMTARFWSLALSSLREFMQRNSFLFSDAPGPVDPWDPTERPVHVPMPRMSTRRRRPRYGFVILGNYQTQQAASVVHGGADPPVTVQDVMYGSARPRGKFDVLGWKSHIPPHYSYMFSCEERVVSRKKRNRKI